MLFFLQAGYRQYCRLLLYKWMKNNSFLDTSFLFLTIFWSRILVKKCTLNFHWLVLKWSNRRLHSHKRLLSDNLDSPPPPSPHSVRFVLDASLTNAPRLTVFIPRKLLHNTGKSDTEQHNSISWYSVSCLTKTVCTLHFAPVRKALYDILDVHNTSATFSRPVLVR